MIVSDLKAQDVLQHAGEEVVLTWFPCGPAMAAFGITMNDGTSAVENHYDTVMHGIYTLGQSPAEALAGSR
ncbi:hypothetical protein [Sphingomonas sp. R86521]|uniref:hypothetical protein n=1 Tax=Sphingomonas sp. R86521 TaxID=3093860 RepID=UPI0036D2D3AB